MSAGVWLEGIDPSRVAPRDCIRAAREELDRAWASSSAHEAQRFVLGAVDWQRRALEQMAGDARPLAE